MIGSIFMLGGGGDDELIGDHVRRSSAPDTFVFSTGDGHDTVVDYVEFDDTLDFSNWQGIESFADVVNHAHEVDGGVAIRASDPLTATGMLEAVARLDDSLGLKIAFDGQPADFCDGRSLQNRITIASARTEMIRGRCSTN